MITFQASLDVTPELIRLKRIAGRFSDFKPVLGGRIDVLARRLIRKQFETEGRAAGGGWKALTQNYTKRRRFPGRPILRQTDALYEALTVKGHPNQETVLERDQYSLTVAEDAVDEDGKSLHARFIGHMFGVEKSNVPARPPIPPRLPKNFIEEVRRAVKAYVVRGET